jgi:hypothetical protein
VIPAFAVLGLAVLSVLLGPPQMPPSELVEAALSAGSSDAAVVLWQVRAPPCAAGVTGLPVGAVIAPLSVPIRVVGEDLLADVYRVEARVLPHPANGLPTVVPLP